MTSFGPTPREQEILLLLVAGHDAAAIAERLSLSVFTVRNCLARLRRIHGAPHTIGLIALVWERRYEACQKELVECRRALAALDRRGRVSE